MNRIIVLVFILCNLSCNNDKRNLKSTSNFTSQKQSVNDSKKEKSGLEMIRVKGGEFIMGGRDNVDDGGAREIRIADECPHSVTLNSFQIGKYEVTQSDWFKIMGTNPNASNPCEDCPVSQVSWDDIQNLIKKLNLKYREDFRLPTEEEWEFAARRFEKQRFCVQWKQ